MCMHPLLACDYGLNSETGKRLIKICRGDFDLDGFYDHYGSDNIIELDCGHCFECLQKRKKIWAERLALEASYSSDNYFITLTYSKDHDLNKHDPKLFINMLYKLGYKNFKYFITGELGDITKRAHYHCIILNLPIKDIREDAHGHLKSAEINRCWNRGIVDIQTAPFASMVYTAGYTYKKFGQDGIFLFSKGIGKQYLLDHKDSIIENGAIYFGFDKSNHKANVFRYARRILGEENFTDGVDDFILKKKVKVNQELLDHHSNSLQWLYDNNLKTVHKVRRDSI